LRRRIAARVRITAELLTGTSKTHPNIGGRKKKSRTGVRLPCLTIGFWLRTSAAATGLLTAAATAATGPLAAAATATTWVTTATAAARTLATATTLTATAAAATGPLAATTTATALTGFLLTFVTDVGVVTHRGLSFRYGAWARSKPIR
jgi:hypothetical protein